MPNGQSRDLSPARTHRKVPQQRRPIHCQVRILRSNLLARKHAFPLSQTRTMSSLANGANHKSESMERHDAGHVFQKSELRLGGPGISGFTDSSASL